MANAEVYNLNSANGEDELSPLEAMPPFEALRRQSASVTPEVDIKDESIPLPQILDTREDDSPESFSVPEMAEGEMIYGPTNYDIDEATLDDSRERLDAGKKEYDSQMSTLEDTIRKYTEQIQSGVIDSLERQKILAEISSAIESCDLAVKNFENANDEFALVASEVFRNGLIDAESTQAMNDEVISNREIINIGQETIEGAKLLIDKQEDLSYSNGSGELGPILY